MKTKLTTLFLSLMLISFGVFAQEETLEQKSFNVLSIPNGAYILKGPATFNASAQSANKISTWSNEAIIDGSNQKGWSSAEDSEFPYEFVFELSEECLIEKFGFNNECEKKYPGICAKKVKVEVSTTSPVDNYKTVLDEKLGEYAPTKYYEIKPTTARWIKITIQSNYGYKKFTELMEIEAWGTYVNDDLKSIDLTGDWTSTWGTVSIRQKGSSTKGCYEYRNGIIKNAGMERRILNFSWIEDEGKRPFGKAVLVVNEEGTRLNGIWCYEDDLSEYGIWVFKRKGKKPTRCYQVEEVAKDTVKQNQLKEEIETTGKLTVYGINFEINSATIKEESFPTLDEIFNMLKDNEKMQLIINGHTDSQGSAEYNKTLSSNRAESVKTYLVSKGIATNRLDAFGMGEEMPIANNESQLGRAANRRVELILKR